MLPTIFQQNKLPSLQKFKLPGRAGWGELVSMPTSVESFTTQNMDVFPIMSKVFISFT